MGWRTGPAIVTDKLYRRLDGFRKQADRGDGGYRDIGVEGSFELPRHARDATSPSIVGLA